MRLRTGLALALALSWLPAAAGGASDAPAPAHGLAMHGDLKYPPDFTHFDYVNPDAPKGGEMRVAALGTFDSFNPFIVKGNPAAGASALRQSLLYDSLLAHAQDEPFSLYGLLAESVQTPDDRSWVAFTLREEARWHDGEPVTAEDVIWTFETLTEKGSPLFRFYFGGVDRAEKTGPRSVRFHFEPGENRELPLILGEMPILPRHYWEGREFDKTTLDPPLGSGPYRIGRFEPGRFVTYERAKDYWGRDLAVNRGRFNFDVHRYDYYRDSTVAIEAFKGGAFDFRAENSAKEWATAYDTPAFAEGRLVKETVSHQQAEGMQAFVFNTRRPIFQHAVVRRALAYAFDFEWSNRTLFYDQYKRTRSYFQNSELAATGLPGPAELEVLERFRGRIPEEVFTAEYQPPRTDGSGNARANLRRAVELLREAGWKLEDGVMTHAETGRKLDFEVLLVSPQFERIVLPFAKNLERIGVKARVRTVDTAQYRNRINDFDFDVVVGSFRQSLSPGNEQRDFWGSEAAERPGSRNLAGIRDPVVDELVELLIAAPDREALVARARALDRVLQWSHYVIPQFHIDVDRLVYWNKFGFPPPNALRGVSLDAWWVDPEKAKELGGRPASRP